MMRSLPRAQRAKKAPRKAHVPGGQRTLLPFRERLDAITLACGRTRCSCFRGEEASAARRGVYRSGWAASVPTPTAAGSSLPSQGADPSTWFVGLRAATLHTVRQVTAFVLY